MAVLNAPSNFHDSNIADYGFYGALEEVYERDGRKIVIDSALKVANVPYLIKTSQMDPLDLHGIAVNLSATAIYQLSK